MNRTAYVITGLAVLSASAASAQQWSALDRVPRPFNMVAVDSSMTMAVTYPTGGWNPLGYNRLSRAKELLTGFPSADEGRGAMYLFKDQFVWGTYSYSGAVYAHVKDGTGSVPNLGPVPNTIQIPAWNNLASSYARTRDEINGLSADYCLNTGKRGYHCLEQYFPGGAAGVNDCILPAPNALCAADRPVLEALIRNPINGLVLPNLPTPPGYPGPDYPATWRPLAFACDNLDPSGYPDNPIAGPLPAGCPRASAAVPYDETCSSTLDVGYELAHEIHDTQWPHTPDVNEIAAQVCDPLRRATGKMQQKLNACMVAAPTLSPMFSCNPSQIAASICLPGSVFKGGSFLLPNGSTATFPESCVCDPLQPGCSPGGAGPDHCGVQLRFRARQQVGVCHSYDATREPARTVADTTGAPGDKVLQNRADPATFCRSNVLMVATDGADTHPLGVGPQSPGVAAFYSHDAPGLQASVINAASPGDGNGLQNLIRGATPAISALESVGQVRARLARELNRSLKGVYAASAPAFSQYQNRAAFMVMEVPGTSSPAHLDYFGRPLRMEWWEIDPVNGSRMGAAPIFSTDETARAGMGRWANPAVVPPSLGVNGVLGPGGVWTNARPINMNKLQNWPAGTLDRNGDGVIGDQPLPVTWGYHLGGEGSRPIIVGAPMDVPEGNDRGDAAVWQSTPAVRMRDRVAYALSNGFLHAYRVGHAGGVETIAGVDVGVGYTDVEPDIGQEIFRYQPDFIRAVGNRSSEPVGGVARYRHNAVVQQSIIDRGQLFVRDVQLTNPAPPAPPRFATVLVMSQGAGGRGFAALDITDPNAVGDAGTILWDRLLLSPGALAVAPPTIYMWPHPTGGDPIPALVVAGGAVSPPAPGDPDVDFLYVYRLVDGTLIDSIGLPRSGSQRAWPNTPVCVDRDGAGRMDRCFVLASDGTIALARVGAADGRFVGATAADITPGDLGVRDGTKVFNSGLTAYFTSDNQVALVFGSGDARKIERGDSVGNVVYKIISKGSGSSVVATTGQNACRPGGTLQDGAFPLPAGEMMVAPAMVSKGTVAFATYRPGATGCLEGASYLYAFDFENCRNTLIPGSTTKPSTGVNAGAGLPSQPILMRASGKLMVSTTANPAVAFTRATLTRGGVRENIRPLFFRIRSSSR